MKEGSIVKYELFDAFVMCGDFLVWGSALPVLLDIYLFSINLNIDCHSLSQFLLHHIDWNLNTFKSLLRKRSPFHISFEISEFAAFFMVVSSYIPSIKQKLKPKKIKTFVFFPRVLTWSVCISNIFPKMDSTHTTLSLFFTWFLHSIFS